MFNVSFYVYMGIYEYIYIYLYMYLYISIICNFILYLYMKYINYKNYKITGTISVMIYENDKPIYKLTYI